MSSNADDPSGQPASPSPRYRPRPNPLDDDFESDERESPGSTPAAPEPGGGGGGDFADIAQPATFSAPAEPPAAETIASSTDFDSRCVFMGPSGSGKTTLLVAFDQACSCPPESDAPSFRLEFIGGQGTDELAESGVRTVMDNTHSPVGSVINRAYQASITATEARTFWRPSRQHVAHLTFRDGPGGALFPREKDLPYFEIQLAEWEKKLLTEAKDAEILVLCVDATKPSPDLITRYMSIILAKLGTVYHPRRDDPLGYRLLRKVRLTPEAPRLLPERRIKAKRFLLLLTKIDELVSFQTEWAEKPGEDFAPPTPAYLAKRLSPVRMACELLDDSNLLRILNALQPEAEFAVGLTSAWGFNPFTGRPFMEQNNPVGMSTQDRAQRLLNWRPFGLREALLFITAGAVGGPVERVDAGSLGTRLQAPLFDVPHQFFNTNTAESSK